MFQASHQLLCLLQVYKFAYSFERCRITSVLELIYQTVFFLLLLTGHRSEDILEENEIDHHMPKAFNAKFVSWPQLFCIDSATFASPDQI